MTRRTIHTMVHLLSGLLILVLLAACGAPAADAPTTDTPVAETPTTDAPTTDTPVAETPTTDTPAAATGDAVVNVYSARHYGAVEAVFNRFTEETGIEVRLSQGSVQSLVERMLAEGPQTPADAFISIDAGGLWLIANEGLLEPIESEVLTENIPDILRDPENRWFGLSRRVRTIMYNPDAVGAEEVPATYADLADPQWRDRLCLRPATHIYTIALVAGMISNRGEAETEEIVQGWVANNPTYLDSDTRILETVAAGGCDVAIANHYYLGRILNEDPDFPVEVTWANQETTGVHRNIIGMGVLQSARNQENAVRLLEWLATEGQGATPDTLPGSNFEFPVNPDAEVDPLIAGFGEWTVDPIDLNEYGRNQAAAIQLLERAGYGFAETAGQ